MFEATSSGASSSTLCLRFGSSLSSAPGTALRQCARALLRFAPLFFAAARDRAYEHELLHSCGMLDPDRLRDDAAEREAHHVRRFPAELVQQSNMVVDEIGQRVCAFARMTVFASFRTRAVQVIRWNKIAIMAMQSAVYNTIVCHGLSFDCPFRSA